MTSNWTTEDPDKKLHRQLGLEPDSYRRDYLLYGAPYLSTDNYPRIYPVHIQILPHSENRRSFNPEDFQVSSTFEYGCHHIQQSDARRLSTAAQHRPNRTSVDGTASDRGYESFTETSLQAPARAVSRHRVQLCKSPNYPNMSHALDGLAKVDVL